MNRFDYPEDIMLQKKYDNNYPYKRMIDSLSLNNFFSPFDFYSNPYWSGITYVEKDNYLYVDQVCSGEEKIVNEGYFNYRMNENGFRSKSFKEFNNEKTNILFTGCSISQGVGLPEELSWPNKLVDLMQASSKNLDIDFYNLSVNGSGIFLSIKNIFTFIKTVGKPDYIFALLPQVTRSLGWKLPLGFQNVHYENPKVRTDESVKSYRDSYIHENSLMTNMTMISILEYMCSVLEIKLLWSSWRIEDVEIYKDMGLNNFFELSHQPSQFMILHPSIHELWHGKNTFYDLEYPKITEEMNKKNVYNEEYFFISRDGIHPGSYATQLIAEDFFKELGRK